MSCKEAGLAVADIFEVFNKGVLISNGLRSPGNVILLTLIYILNALKIIFGEKKTVQKAFIN